MYNFGGEELFCYHCQPVAIFVMQQLSVTEAVALSQCGFGEGEVFPDWNFKLYGDKKLLVPQVGLAQPAAYLFPSPTERGVNGRTEGWRERWLSK